MAPKLGIVLAMALTMLTSMASATPNWSPTSLGTPMPITIEDFGG